MMAINHKRRRGGAHPPFYPCVVPSLLPFCPGFESAFSQLFLSSVLVLPLMTSHEGILRRDKTAGRRGSGMG